MDLQVSTLNAWKRQHRELVESDYSSFKHKQHPIKKTKYAKKTVYFCLKCHDSFTKIENNIMPQKEFGFNNRIEPGPRNETQLAMDRLDRLWVKCIKTRAGFKSEYSGRGGHTFDLIDAHHILGKSTFALRYSLENGVCITRTEHANMAHSTSAALQKEFKEWAVMLRNTDRNKISARFEIGNSDFDEIAAYLKENLAILEGKHTNLGEI